MRFVSFTAEGRASFGIARPDGVFDLGARLGGAVPDLETWLRVRALDAAPPLPPASTTDFATGEFAYAPVVTHPDKILCVGINYEEHRKETGRDVATHPTIFTRFADTLVAHREPLRAAAVSEAFDFEGELAVVIGREGRHVPEDAAAGIVAGYTCFNDGTMRDWQRHSSQFTPGKNFPGTGALGPELVTADELERFADRRIVTRLNGVVMQDAVLGDMIFGVPRLIAYITTFTRLRPGDVIATGTPGGVGFRQTPPRLLRDGDEVEVSIEGVGRLVNPVAPERA
jgi:2-keto-4-pentenoate hydratase/2-oxohepta-3-ene-1,7-dioic acid hydratase in catechol pathway